MIANKFKCAVQVMSFLMDIVPRLELICELKFLAVMGMPASPYMIDLGRATDNNIQASLAYMVNEILANLNPRQALAYSKVRPSQKRKKKKASRNGITVGGVVNYLKKKP